MEGRGARWFFRLMTLFVLAFLYVPLGIVVLYAFNKTRTASWPPDLWTTKWFTEAWHDPALRPSLLNSLKAGIAATSLALVLGTLASFGIHRFRFFGRDTISFALVLPIALPGIVTALALNSMVEAVPFISFGLPAIIVGHATFCVVVVFNNVVARLRRTSGSFVEASMDLGADGIQTFRYVTLPAIRTALLAGGLLAFGLSFDEIVVTIYLSGTQSTLPLWIFNNLQRPTSRPIVNVVAMVVLLLSLIPVYIAQRIAGEGAIGSARRERQRDTDRPVEVAPLEEAGPG
jgi:putative spermidine/putrescine transport system permease protein